MKNKNKDKIKNFIAEKLSTQYKIREKTRGLN